MEKSTIRSATAVCLILMMAAWAAHEYQANNAADYYSSHPERVLYALAITALVVAAGGTAVVVFRRLSPQGQHIATLMALGSTATLISAFSVHACYMCLVLSRSVFVVVSGTDVDVTPLFMTPAVLGLALVSAMMVAAAAVSWYWFCRVLRKGKAKSP